MRLKNKLAVITAAASGMGRAGVELFAREGATVAAVDINAAALKAVASDANAKGGKVIPIVSDLSTIDGVRQSVGEAAAALGSIDRGKLNIKGGSVALGHPFAATGTRIVASLAKILAADSTAKRGLVSVCTAGGMATAAYLEV